LGLLTVDALRPGAFEDLGEERPAGLAALAGMTLRTGLLMENLEREADKKNLLAKGLVHETICEIKDRRLIGTSKVIEKLRADIKLVAHSDLSVLITGETGSGKELVAQGIYAQSARGEAPFIHVNCAALPESVAESELFGHELGAFTGADRTRPGRFEVADGGTIFLDEGGELPLGIQPKMLRVLQEGEIQRVGSDRPLRVNVRVIAATNRDLEREIERGHFRADLFHRLNIYPIRVPSLMERREDIPLLAGFFCDQACRRLGIGPVRLSPSARESLKEQTWPGNVRELEHFILRSVLISASRHTGGREPLVLEAEDLKATSGAQEPGAVVAAMPGRLHRPGLSLKEAVDEFRRKLIRECVAAEKGNWSAAARLLGLHRSNLHQLASRLDLHPNQAPEP
ncbi:MAG: nitric oxide reductase transcriptional regulator NorR, partial [Planctomycetes bacterium]|nr:nitric oxide reductase transcriptional regulator NorR [Planctomycetota bacterium]